MRAGRAIVAFALAAALMASPSCATSVQKPPENALADQAITVGSFDFPESELLARIYGQAMQRGGYHVRFALNLGPREFVEPAINRGLIEFLPEYAGTALYFLSLNDAVPTPSATANHDALVRVLRRTPVAALAAARAQDSNAFAVTRDTAHKYRLHDISDLRHVASRLTFAGPPECPSRPFCLVGLRRTYHLAIKRFLTTDAGGPLTVQALDSGLVDVALLFSTDPRLVAGGLVQLRDDLHLQPAESVTPLVRREVLRTWGPKLVRLVDRVSTRITTDKLRKLNRQVIIGKQRPSEVAADWLQREGIR